MGILISLVIAALVIFIVDKLMTSMKVGGPVACLKVAVVNAVIGAILFAVIPQTVLTAPFAVFGAKAWAVAEALVNFVIAAAALMLSDKLLSDFEVQGFSGALTAAVMIALVRFALRVVLGL